MEFIKRTIKVGNSAGVLLPKKLLGAEVKIIVLKKPIDYKKIIFKFINPYLEEVKAICLTQKNPLNFIVITLKIKKIIKNSQIRINFVPESIFLKDFKEKNILREKIKKSLIILNKDFFNNLENFI
ncbi:MAG: DUF2080 family transposase-associated protein [Candidatus Pacearchaeota archaeon]